jgi:hypothetical protein
MTDPPARKAREGLRPSGAAAPRVGVVGVEHHRGPETEVVAVRLHAHALPNAPRRNPAAPAVGTGVRQLRDVSGTVVDLARLVHVDADIGGLSRRRGGGDHSCGHDERREDAGQCSFHREPLRIDKSCFLRIQ